VTKRISLTLSQVFLITLLGLILLLGLLFYLLLNRSRMSILTTSERLRLEVGLPQ